MAKPGFRNHRKFRRLVAALHIPEAHALGHVELLWSTTYETGSAYLGDEVDVELAAGWTGDPGALCSALLLCGGKTQGLIEEVEPGIYQVHDLLDHAPDYVGDRAKRALEAQEDKVCEHCGAIFRSPDARAHYCTDACRKLAWKAKQKGDGSGQMATDGDRPIRPPTSQATDQDGSRQVGTESDEVPSPAQPSPAPFKRLKDKVAETPSRPARTPSWGRSHPPEILDVTSEILAEWPHHKSDTQPCFDPKKPPQPVPVSSAPEVAQRLAEIVKEGGKLDVCKAIATRAVREFRSEGKWIKAAQHFFGKSPEAPWRAYYQAHITNQAFADEPEPEPSGVAS
jgi:hypothetical protein